MDARRASRMVIDPKVRQVGFVTPGAPPDRTQSSPVLESTSPLVSDMSSAGNSLSPVMIPPSRQLSDNLSSTLALQSTRAATATPVPVPISPRRKVTTTTTTTTTTTVGGQDVMPLGSYNNPSESVLRNSPMPSPSSKISDGEFYEDLLSPGSRVSIPKRNPGKVASSLPSGGICTTKNSSKYPVPSSLTTVSVVKMPPGVSEKVGGIVEVENELVAVSKPLKEKTSKAERRALQESQRAAKAAAKSET